MQIISNFMSRVPIDSSGPTQAGLPQRNGNVGQVGVSDRTTLSDLGSYDSLEGKLERVADVRSEKVNALRQSILTGTYKVSPDQIAVAMRREVTGA